jgi:hypothetical protein
MSEGLDELVSAARWVEPMAGAATASDVDRLARLVDAIADADLDDDERVTAFFAVERVAAVAIALDMAYTRFLDLAEKLAVSDELRGEVEAARSHPEAFRTLVHGRWLIANRRERLARKLWVGLRKDAPAEALRRAADAELSAPRPLEGGAPTLATLNGVGLNLFGNRDPWEDGSYVATHCFCVFFPVIPLRAYRVRNLGDSRYLFLAREQLSTFAKVARGIVLGSAALAIAVAILYSVLHDPYARDKERLDDAIALSRKGEPERALEALDEALASSDLVHVGDRADEAGAAIVRLSAGYVPAPFTRDAVEQAHRVVLRWQALPTEARAGAARDAMLAALDGWIEALVAPDDLEAKRRLLVDAADVAGHGRYDELLRATRLELADRLAAEMPADALGVLLDRPVLVDKAGEILDGLVDSPSLLADVAEDVDAWLEAAPDDPRAAGIRTAKELGIEARDGDMKNAPAWNQHAVVALAGEELAAGKVAAAEKRLRAIGPPGRMIRDARYLLAQIAGGDGRLEEADALLSQLVRGRLARFLAARADYEQASKAAYELVDTKLTVGDVPQALRDELENATEEVQREKVQAWAADQVEGDPAVKRASQAYATYGDVVRFALAAGTIKLRRAQGLADDARAAMLADAEHMFLAIRTEAEGQPEFQLGLGEVYARLGKAKESDAELQQVLDRKDDDLTLAVARVYRSIGSVARAQEIARGVQEHADTAHRQYAAVLLFLMANSDEERAAWLDKADPKDPFVRTSKLELEGRRAARTGDDEACDRAFSKAAKAHLAMGRGGYNNAALAQQQRFFCTGDVRVLAEAEATLERAFRDAPENAIVVGNLASMLAGDAELRVLARRIDIAELRLGGETEDVIDVLLAGSEREKVLAELAADPGYRRSVELTAQEQVLAPNRTDAYERVFDDARRRREVAAMRDAVARMRAAGNLDTSEAAAGRQRWVSGELDEEMRDHAKAQVARAEKVAASKGVDARTRGVAHLLAGRAHSTLALLDADVAEAARAREEAAAAHEQWPALEVHADIVSALVDEAGMTADAKRWAEARRTRGGSAIVSALVAEHDPMGDRILATAAWKQIAVQLAADPRPPGLGDVRIARLIGDRALIDRVSAALTDERVQLGVEATAILTPDDPTIADDRALLSSGR